MWRMMFWEEAKKEPGQQSARRHRNMRKADIYEGMRNI